MLYLYLSLLFVFLAMITGCFFRSLHSSQIPPNAKLVIDAWNATPKHYIPRDTVSYGSARPLNPLNHICSGCLAGKGDTLNSAAIRFDFPGANNFIFLPVCAFNENIGT